MTQGTSPAVGATPIGARDIETTYKGIALVARGPEPMPDPFETQMLSAVLVRWHELRRLSLVDPWPCFRIRWSSRGVRAEDAYGPRGDADAHDFARAVERLVEVTRVHAEHLIDQGWLAAPDTPWEPTSSQGSSIHRRCTSTPAPRGPASSPTLFSGWHLPTRPTT